jgi:hypothetical protein
MDAGSCNACHVTGTTLMKLSLGKDFFGRTYDRLSPSSDQSPKWYCESCSMMKNLQRDYRDIRMEFDKLAKGQASALSEPEAKQRAQLRLQEIAAIATTQPAGSPLLSTADVKHLIEQFHARA